MDWTILQFLLPAIAASLIIAGIHAYLGLHVVERGVIFVDLSLAQIASLGAAIAVWQGYDPHEPADLLDEPGVHAHRRVRSSRWSRGTRRNIPQEAIIGISYAVASAAVILAMSKATGEAEHLRDMLVGNILSVQWPEVWLTGAHLRRDRHLSLRVPEALSRDLDRPEGGRGARHFGAVLGFPVLRVVRPRGHAVGGDRRRAAGVLLSHRAVGRRACCSRGRIGPRLAIGWVMGMVVSMLGMYFSVLFDLPTGATIVCTFGLVLMAMAAVRALMWRSSRSTPA